MKNAVSLHRRVKAKASGLLFICTRWLISFAHRRASGKSFRWRDFDDISTCWEAINQQVSFHLQKKSKSSDSFFFAFVSRDFLIYWLLLLRDNHWYVSFKKETFFLLRWWQWEAKDCDRALGRLHSRKKKVLEEITGYGRRANCCQVSMWKEVNDRRGLASLIVCAAAAEPSLLLPFKRLDCMRKNRKSSSSSRVVSFIHK